MQRWLLLATCFPAQASVTVSFCFRDPPVNPTTATNATAAAAATTAAVQLEVPATQTPRGIKSRFHGNGPLMSDRVNPRAGENGDEKERSVCIDGGGRQGWA